MQGAPEGAHDDDGDRVSGAVRGGLSGSSRSIGSTSAFRIFTVIPIAIVPRGRSGAQQLHVGTTAVTGEQAARRPAGAPGARAALMIIFRQKYPRWWFDFNVQLLSFTNRVGAYFCC